MEIIIAFPSKNKKPTLTSGLVKIDFEMPFPPTPLYRIWQDQNRNLNELA
ncbi:hypothetical protein SBA4_3580014 [Candidatus Sulfopaludibacter sp. SbA4]|nr:hypothetical protein SBA4_3580014 [Candidatus Sulfopaludibacter sp. SbA4]